MNRWILLTVGCFLVSSLTLSTYAGEGCGGAKADSSAAVEDSVKTIDTAGLQQIIERDQGATIVDARGGKWDDGKRIPGAIALTSDASDEQIAESLPNKDAQIVTYCTDLKCQASHKLSERLQKLGYQNVVRYPDGIKGWTEAGKKVVETAKPGTPEG